jgi:hypothetical protein
MRSSTITRLEGRVQSQHLARPLASYGATLSMLNYQPTHYRWTGPKQPTTAPLFLSSRCRPTAGGAIVRHPPTIPDSSAPRPSPSHLVCGACRRKPPEAPARCGRLQCLRRDTADHWGHGICIAEAAMPTGDAVEAANQELHFSNGKAGCFLLDLALRWSATLTCAIVTI